MILNKATTNFVEMLKSRPEVLGVILFGSWARGNNRPDSDVDLLIIVTEGFRRTVEYNGSQAFEIIYTTEQAVLGYWQHHTDDCAGLWAVAKVLYDREGAVLRLQLGAAQLLGKGKKAIDAF